jgi:hypothetical protein
MVDLTTAGKGNKSRTYEWSNVALTEGDIALISTTDRFIEQQRTAISRGVQIGQIDANGI